MTSAALIAASFCIFSITVPTEAQAGDGYRVLDFVPVGSTSDVRSVKAKFSEDIAGAGDPTIPAPFTWNCAVKGDSAWVDSKTWTLNFGAALPIGTKCEFSLKPDLAALSGAKAQGQTQYFFETSGLDVKAVRPSAGGELEEAQVFAVGLNGKVDRASIQSKTFLYAEGLASPIQVKLLDGPEAATVIKAQFSYDAKEYAQFLVMRPVTKLPQSKKVTLVFEKGIKGENGAEFEVDKTFEYRVRDPFRISTTCSRDNDAKRCNPFQAITVNFNNPVPVTDFAKIRVVDGTGKTIKIKLSDYDLESGNFSYFLLPSPHNPNSEIQIQVAGGLKDVDGRELSNVALMPIKLGIDEYPPLAKFASEFGVIEYTNDAAVPVTVRQVAGEAQVKVAKLTIKQTSLFGKGNGFVQRLIGREPDHSEMFKTVISYHEAIQENRYSRKRYLSPTIDDSDKALQISQLSLPKVLPPNDMEVVGIPVKEPGFHIYEIASTKLAQSYMTKAEGETMYVPAAFQVTNLGVHFKIGRENSLVWVTELATGTPAAKATVTLMGCSKQAVWTGAADKDGIAVYQGDVREILKCDRDKTDGSTDEEYNERPLQPFYVFAHRGDDFAFARSNWTDGVENWRWSFYGPYNNTYPLTAHSVLDRTLLRAGETVHFKHILRKQTVSGFRFDTDQPFDSLEITHYGSGETTKVPASWQGQTGSGDSTWEIPKNAKLGTYSASLWSTKSNRQLHVANFDVQEFRVPLTKAFIKVPAENLVAVKELPLQFGIQYLAGGGVGGSDATLVAQYRDSSYHFYAKAHENYSFNQGPAKLEGRSYDRDTSSEFESIPVKMDDKGQASHTIAVKPTQKKRTYHFELSYLDPNGETRTYSANKDILPDTWSIGIDSSQWLLKSNQTEVKTLLVDEHGNPLSGKPVKVQFLKLENLSHRKKLAGGVYSYENKSKLVNLKEECSGSTDSAGRFVCNKTVSSSGTIIAQVSTSNKNGQQLITNHHFYVPSSKNDDMWFAAESSDRIDLLADKKEYEPGDIATIQIRSPFRSANALVTVEREGIIDHKVVILDGSSPSHDLKIGDRYAPNVYVSVFTVRGRIDTEKPTAMIDLGKPAFKTGKLELKVGWNANRLNVDVKPERDVYKVREKARVRIKIRAADGTPLPKDAEVAIAAIDEGLLELKANDSWELLTPMMSRRDLAVETFTSQMQIIGKRHYGLKAVNPGGGGGMGASGNPRELFETLLIWSPHVKLNDDGEALVDIPLNDSLTSFRIAAIATAGADRFGSGFGRLSTTKDLILFAGMPPVVRDGDEIESKLTVRNTTASPVTTSITARIRETNATILQQDVEIGANASRDIRFRQKIALKPGDYTFETTAKVGNITADQVITKQKVIEVHAVRVQQASLEQLTAPMKFTYAPPEGALPDRGDLRVSGQSSLLPSLETVKEYGRVYPYSCFEQKLSKIMMTDDKAAFDNLASVAGDYLDHHGNLKYFQTMSRGSPVLTAYALQITHARGWTWPEATQARLISGLKAYTSGQLEAASDLKTRSDVYGRISALEALSRYSSVQAGDLDATKLDLNSWPTSVLIDLFSIAHRTKDLKGRDELLTKLENSLRNRITWSGSKMSFQTDATDHLSWMMVSPDLNALRLTNAAIEFKTWQSDIGKYMKGSLSRLKQGHWDLTTANAWGMATARRFSEVYESKPVSGTTTAIYAGETKSLSWKSGKTEPAGFGWKPGPQPLEISHQGSGSPWVLVQSLAAIKRTAHYGTGLQISKSMEGLQGANPNALKVGDLVSVVLTIKVQAAQDWLVIHDPVPSGSTLMGKGLGGESTARSAKTQSDAAYPTFVELAHDSVRSYYEFINDGTFRYSYTLRINNAGTFMLPATRAEALYSPEIFAEFPNADLVVKPAN